MKERAPHATDVAIAPTSRHETPPFQGENYNRTWNPRRESAARIRRRSQAHQRNCSQWTTSKRPGEARYSRLHTWSDNIPLSTICTTSISRFAFCQRLMLVDRRLGSLHIDNGSVSCLCGIELCRRGAGGGMPSYSSHLHQRCKYVFSCCSISHYYALLVII